MSSANCLRWDNGTLILGNSSSLPAIQALPGLEWDPSTEVYRAPAWRYAELSRAAADQGIALEDEVMLQPPRPRPPTNDISLRPYQTAALNAWRAAGRRGLVVLPTGAGKTRMAAACIMRLACRALVLVPTLVLLEQWHRSLRSLGFPDSELGRYGDGHRDERPITIATFASARLHMADLGNRFQLLVVDECHHFGGSDKALEMCCAPWRLGLTATPPVDECKLERLVRSLGPEVFRSRISDLAGEFLSPYELVTLKLEMTQAEGSEYEASMGAFRPVCRNFFRTSPRSTWREFVATAARDPTVRQALAAHRRARRIVRFAVSKQKAVKRLLRRHHRQRVLVFTADNAAAYQIAREHLVMPFTCDIGRVERADTLARFSRGELKTLVSARVLNEGVDVPSADVAILVAGAHGSREYVQRVGRVLRPAADKRAVIYELVLEGTHEARQLERGRRRLAGEKPAAVPFR